ncbi:MAG: protein translocase subunit SecD, partial [Patescibacteria group bacterium]
TTLIACAILYWLSSSFIQGFALTLAVGVLMSMFSAITVTRMMLKGVAKWKWLQKGWLYCVKDLRA